MECSGAVKDDSMNLSLPVILKQSLNSRKRNEFFWNIEYKNTSFLDNNFYIRVEWMIEPARSDLPIKLQLDRYLKF